MHVVKSTAILIPNVSQSTEFFAGIEKARHLVHAHRMKFASFRKTLGIDLADLKTQLERSRADLAAAEADYRLNELAYNRYKELARQEVISKGEFDNHTAQFQVSTAKLRAAEAAYRQAGQQYGYGTLLADADGVIADIKVEAGQVVSAGQAALTLVRAGEMEVQIHVPEQRVEEIRKAAKIRVN